ncbi:UNVERIFIED_CONTAM: hypothetical protein K2H54_072097 [Gekko kuhli]
MHKIKHVCRNLRCIFAASGPRGLLTLGLVLQILPGAQFWNLARFPRFQADEFIGQGARRNQPPCRISWLVPAATLNDILPNQSPSRCILAVRSCVLFPAKGGRTEVSNREGPWYTQRSAPPASKETVVVAKKHNPVKSNQAQRGIRTN